MKTQLSNELISCCREHLLQLKFDLLNRLRSVQVEFTRSERNSGDEIDNSVALLTQNNLLLSQERLRFQVLEVECALARIEQGQFGICEETEEFIEEERLLAVPWTRLSIEGAEIREDLEKRFAR